MQRTPPCKSSSLVDLNQATVTSECDKVAIRTYKRPRSCSSPQNDCSQSLLSAELATFKIDLMEKLDSWKDDLEKRLEAWKIEQDTTLSIITKDILHLKNEMAGLQKTTLEIDSGMSFINKMYEDVKNKVSILEMANKESQAFIFKLEMKLEDFQQQSRCSTLEIRNVPVKADEKPSDLISVLQKIGKVVDMNLEQNELRDIYRLPGKPENIRPIVAEFLSVSIRNELLSRIRQFNKKHPVPDKLNTKNLGIIGDVKPIYVDDHLVPTMKKLFYDVRQYSREMKYSCWQYGGKILVKKIPDGKVIQIRSEQCLRNLKKYSKEE